MRRAAPALLAIPLAYLIARFGSSLGIAAVFGLIVLCSAAVLAVGRIRAIGGTEDLGLPLQEVYSGWFGARRRPENVTQPEFATLLARVAHLEHESKREQSTVEQLRADLESLRKHGGERSSPALLTAAEGRSGSERWALVDWLSASELVEQIEARPFAVEVEASGTVPAIYSRLEFEARKQRFAIIASYLRDAAHSRGGLGEGEWVKLMQVALADEAALLDYIAALSKRS